MAKAAQPTRRHAAAPALPAAATSFQAPGRPTPLAPQAATSGTSNPAAATACLNTCGNRRTPARSDTGAATGLNARPPANTAQRPSLPSDPPPGSAPLPAGLQLTASRRSSPSPSYSPAAITLSSLRRNAPTTRAWPGSSRLIRACSSTRREAAGPGHRAGGWWQGRWACGRSFHAQSLQHELHGVIEAAASLAKRQSSRCCPTPVQPGC